MRLRSLVPDILPATLVSALNVCGIKTNSDLLFARSSMDILSRLPPGVVSLAELRKYIALVAETASVPGIRAVEMLKTDLDTSSNAYDFGTGIPELDQLVKSFETSRVYEITGNRESGKTVLAQHVVLRHLAMYPESSTLWIDTTADFSPQRLPKLLQFYQGEGIETVLERFQISFLFDANAVHSSLEALRVVLAANSEPRIRCLVIDSITSVLGPTLNAVSSYGHAVMEASMRQLRDLAQTFSLTVLVINNTSAFAPYNPLAAQDSNIRKPALGPSFTYMTDCTIWLAKEQDNPLTEGSSNSESEGASMYTAEILKSKMTKSGKRCMFKIRQGVLYAHHVPEK